VADHEYTQRPYTGTFLIHEHGGDKLGRDTLHKHNIFTMCGNENFTVYFVFT